MPLNEKQGVDWVLKAGALLAFPITNKTEPSSLWSLAHPRKKMKWEWDDGADSAVAEMWHFRERLSRSKKVVYAKWFKGRATFLAPDVFIHLRAALRVLPKISSCASDILALLEEQSPLSSKQIRKGMMDQNGFTSKDVERAFRELWQRLLIVGRGEIDDGAFPSLAIASASLAFDAECSRAEGIAPEESLRWIETRLGEENLFFKELRRLTRETPRIQDTIGTLKFEDLVARRPGSRR